MVAKLISILPNVKNYLPIFIYGKNGYVLQFSVKLALGLWQHFC